VLRRQLRRGQVEAFFATLPPVRIGLEACGAAHHWARLLQGLGHAVVLLPPQYIKPYVKRGKNDAIDAAAICEAMSRPGMRFVPTKSAERQAVLMLLKSRDLLVKQRTMLSNAIRGHAAEFGVVVAKGRAKLAELLEDAAAAAVPPPALEMLELLAAEVAGLENRIAAIEARLIAWHKGDPVSRCLATQPGIGPIAAISFALKVPDPSGFRSARHFAAWLGLTPKEHASGGRARPGRISRQGDESLRRLLVLGATAVIRFAKAGRTSPWLLGLLARRPKKLAAVALANKMARTLWAMMVRGDLYRRPQPV
jgi:transposase